MNVNDNQKNEIILLDDEDWVESLHKEKIAIHYADHNTIAHFHDFIEVVYFISGVGTHYVEDSQYNVSSGCVCAMNNNIRHNYGVKSEYCKKLVVKNLVFYPEFLGYKSDDFLSDFLHTKFGDKTDTAGKISFVHLLNDPDKEIEKCFSLIEKELTKKNSHYLDVVRCLLETVLILLLSGRGERIEGKKYNRNYLKIEESIAFLHKRIMNTPTMKETAKEFGFSPEYYSKLFREYTGKSYIQFVQELKCNEACRLLLETDFTNEKIAELCGFSSLKHFYQQFKKYKGITPREYIKINA